MRMANTYLSKQKETARRNLQFTLPRVVSLSSEVRMVEDDSSSLSLLDIYRQTMRKLSAVKAQIESSPKQATLLLSEAGDLPLARYFDRIQMACLASGADARTQVRLANKQLFTELFKHITSSLLPKNILKDWALFTYADPTDYFHMRKQFTAQIAIYGLLEHICCLTRLNPDQFYLSQSSGICQTIRLKFDVNENSAPATQSSSILSFYQQIGEFSTDKPVPFRLTPNIVEFITPVGVHGLLSSIKIAMSRCLVQPQYHFTWILRAILKDEILTCVNRRVNCFHILYLAFITAILKGCFVFLFKETRRKS